MTKIEQLICNRLLRFYSPTQIDELMSTPQKYLNGRTPDAVIASGHGEEVLRIVERLETDES
jgi:uncharacterized protein (DUF2384 family)